jgi:outer membrane lipoprotein SlyB
MKSKNLAVLALAAALAACTTTSPDVIQRGDAQRLSQVQDATVLNVREVTVEGSQSGAGAATGGVLGGIAGSSRSHGRESVAIGVVGAVAGALAGHAIERASTRETAIEILVQLRNGERRAIVQAKGNENFVPGEAVVLVTSGGNTRVVRNPGGGAGFYGTPAPAPAPAYAPHSGGSQAPVYSPGGRQQ